MAVIRYIRLWFLECWSDWHLERIGLAKAKMREASLEIEDSRRALSHIARRKQDVRYGRPGGPWWRKFNRRAS